MSNRRRGRLKSAEEYQALPGPIATASLSFVLT